MKHINKLHITTAAALLATLIVGCGEQTPAPASSPETPSQSQAEATDAALPDGLLATSPLADAVGVVEARKEVKPGSDIVVTGYIGGREEPLVEGRAIFTLADSKAVTPCDAVPGDECETPWDACCVSPEIIKASIASVQVVDADGMVLKHSLTGLGGIKPGSTVTVQGKIAASSSDSALIVNAEKIHVTQKP